MRSHLLVTATAVASLAVIGVADAAPVPDIAAPVERPCTIERLPELDKATYSEVYAGDPSGRWLVGTVWTDDGDSHAVAWRNGRLRQPDVPLHPASFEGVTRSGDIAGWGPSAAGATAFALVDGEYVSLSSPDGARNTYAGAIGTDRIAGYAELLTGPTVPVVWMRDDPARPLVLDLPTGYSGFVVGMTPGGRVVVDAFDASLTTRAFVFSRDLQRRELVAPEPGQIFHVAAAARGVAAGWVESADQALRFDLQTLEATTVDTPVSVGAVNRTGVMGGTRNDTLGPGLVIRIRTKNLPVLVAGGGGTVATITTSGQPAGTSEAPGQTFAAVTWTCG